MAAAAHSLMHPPAARKGPAPSPLAPLPSLPFPLPPLPSRHAPPPTPPPPPLLRLPGRRLRPHRLPQPKRHPRTHRRGRRHGGRAAGERVSEHALHQARLNRWPGHLIPEAARGARRRRDERGARQHMPRGSGVAPGRHPRRQEAQRGEGLHSRRHAMDTEGSEIHMGDLGGAASAKAELEV
ncbi:hypothetical protein PAHAL_2G051100 [Panicum hallii]|uniref:Uncharacterized protein n=1 Tax=Panicum hallii TaxID=206008 RepID=A0A270R4V8_9POAL|nr:hypothetical protein PAHAL_2G051100 [Panicum hallii]